MTITAANYRRVLDIQLSEVFACERKLQNAETWHGMKQTDATAAVLKQARSDQNYAVGLLKAAHDQLREAERAEALEALELAEYGRMLHAELSSDLPFVAEH